MRKLSVLMALVAAFVFTTVDRAHSGGFVVQQVKGFVFLATGDFVTTGVNPLNGVLPGAEGVTVMATVTGSPDPDVVGPAVDASFSGSDVTDETGAYIIDLPAELIPAAGIGPATNFYTLHVGVLPNGFISLTAPMTFTGVQFPFAMNMFVVLEPFIVVETPLPATATLVLTGLLGLGWMRRRCA